MAAALLGPVLPQAPPASATSQVAAATSATSPPPAKLTKGGSTSPCGDIFFIGAQGSGQTIKHNEGLGPEVRYALDEYVKRVPGYHVTWYPVPYPAAPVSAGLATSTYRNTYFQSIASGIKETELILKLRAARCPKERYVFAGYSQGAMVMHRTIYRLGTNKTTRTSRQTLLPRVAAVFAIGDGDKTPYQRGVNYGASDSRRGLIWVIGGDPIWPSARSARIPTTGYGWYPLRFMSICATSDFVCDPTYGIPSIKVHTTSYRPPSGKMLPSTRYAATRAANTTKVALHGSW